MCMINIFRVVSFTIQYKNILLVKQNHLTKKSVYKQMVGNKNTAYAAIGKELTPWKINMGPWDPLMEVWKMIFLLNRAILWFPCGHDQSKRPFCTVGSSHRHPVNLEYNNKQVRT